MMIIPKELVIASDRKGKLEKESENKVMMITLRSSYSHHRPSHPFTLSRSFFVTTGVALSSSLSLPLMSVDE